MKNKYVYTLGHGPLHFGLKSLVRIVMLTLFTFYFSLSTLTAQNTYSLPTASCQSACGVTDGLSGAWISYMCYNLGAETSSLDPFSYNGGALNGDLYQWGRSKDGHQVRTSAATTAASATDVPGHNKFIVIVGSPFDWRYPKNDALWGDTKTANDPCPAGYKVPTLAQVGAFVSATKSWTGNGYAFGSPTTLYLPAGGLRSGQNGAILNVGLSGNYWSSSVFQVNSWYLNFGNGSIITNSTSGYRTSGNSVRCVAE